MHCVRDLNKSLNCVPFFERNFGRRSSLRQLLRFHQHLHEAFASERRPPAFGKDLMRQQSHSMSSSGFTPLNLSDAVVPSSRCWT